ncbi:hypothetical protein ACNJ7E_26270 [Rhodococcus sp. NM-2]|uniref:Uncharacterized protein n=1 Tax=Rhodococcus opacus TaxID=37919 RepID=A0AAX3YSV3_RHOOP|nr:hypothetical protein [Rhodococcus opacus]WLF51554.1 hypothetical protein Q5707_39035 [Rhodococcus opacus]
MPTTIPTDEAYPHVKGRRVDVITRCSFAGMVFSEDVVAYRSMGDAKQAVEQWAKEMVANGAADITPPLPKGVDTDWVAFCVVVDDGVTFTCHTLHHTDAGTKSIWK